MEEEREGGGVSVRGGAVGSEEYSEATEKGQEGGRVGRREFRIILIDTLRKEVVLVR